MSMEIQFLYENFTGERQRASFTSKYMAGVFRRKFIEEHSSRELLVETHDYRRGDV